MAPHVVGWCGRTAGWTSLHGARPKPSAMTHLWSSTTSVCASRTRAILTQWLIPTHQASLTWPMPAAQTSKSFKTNKYCFTLLCNGNFVDKLCVQAAAYMARKAYIYKYFIDICIIYSRSTPTLMLPQATITNSVHTALTRDTAYNLLTYGFFRTHLRPAHATYSSPIVDLV